MLKPYPEQDEPGLDFQSKDLSSRELSTIFGRKRPGDETLNRLMKVLHARRVDGTLDIPLDEDLDAVVQQNSELADMALKWLRPRFPVDEDRAINNRLSREEHRRPMDNPSVLTQRGFNLRLIKPDGALEVKETSKEVSQDKAEYIGPQSGSYYAEVSEEEGDVFGKSQIEKMQAESRKRAATEEEAWKARVDKSMEEAAAKAQERSQAIAQRSEDKTDLVLGKEVRPPNSFEKWVIKNTDRATSSLTLDSPEIRDRTTLQRLGPSALFVIATCVGLYYFTQTWEPPRRIDRAMPNTSLAMATFLSILGINVMVFMAWRYPPVLVYLNRYFMVSPAYPYAVSMIGNIFSHTTLKHLGSNMLLLYLFGPSLHEDVGRANFIAIYLASGIIGSWASLTLHTARRMWAVSCNGASGAVWGTTSAYFWLHRDGHFTLRFLPEEWANFFNTKGWVLYSFLVGWDILAAVRSRHIDWMAHLAGGLFGGISAIVWSAEHRPSVNHKPDILTPSVWSK